MSLDAPHYVQGNYSVADRDRIFAKADKYPDASGGLTNQVPTLTADGTIIWRQQSSGGGDGTANANIAVVEDTSTASQAHAIGDLLVYSGQLYRVTAAIAQGGTITPGTNVTPTTVADELDSSVAGVSSFNGRTGAVTPQNGDYTAADVGALPAPDNAGTIGQVLKKTANGSEWANESGGGGNDANLAPVEMTSTASQAYAVNSFLVYSGQLYRVTAAIAQGDTLTVGTNIAAEDVGTYLAMVAAANAVASAGLAPGGFGLGVANGKTINYTYDLDNLTTGFYSWTASIPTHAPTADNQYCALTVLPRGVQICTSYSSGITQIRYKASDTWGAWEYINPPLSNAGVEYRTIERYIGNPVYVYRTQSKTLPTSGSTPYAVPANINAVIEVFGASETGQPLANYPGITGISFNSTTAQIIVTTSGMESAMDARFCVKYTKSTN